VRQGSDFARKTIAMNGETITYPRCHFSLSSFRDTEAALGRQLELRAPFSMIRLGDGEGVVLGRPTPENVDLWEWVRKQLGAQMTVKQLGQLSDHLEASIETADIIGIRDDIVDVCFPSSSFALSKDQFRDRFLSQFRLRPVDRNLEFAGALRIAHTHKCLSEYRFPKATRFAAPGCTFICRRVAHC
jgi:hypothetical protein